MKQGHDLGVIAMRGCEKIADEIYYYLCEWRENEQHDYRIPARCLRFGTGEAKGVVDRTVRGRDVFIVSDMFNYGITYKMYGQENRMSPDDHFQDLKRTVAALGGKARRVTVIMPMLYEGRQHRKMGRESLDCAIALKELENMRVSNIITFDAHDPRVQNAVPLSDFDNLQPTYQMLKALVKNYPQIRFDKNRLVIVSPDEGGMQRCMYYSSVLGLDLGTFYKKRDYSTVVDGKNPIESHRWLGTDVSGKDIIIVDDMISSGDSMLDVAGKLKAMGAENIFVFATFGLFCNGLKAFDEAYEKGLFTRIFTTNLIYRREDLLSRQWYCEVNMAKYLAYIIDAINEECSVSEMFNPYTKIRLLMRDRNEMD